MLKKVRDTHLKSYESVRFGLTTLAFPFAYHKLFPNGSRPFPKIFTNIPKSGAPDNTRHAQESIIRIHLFSLRDGGNILT